jgi:branched-chain amino acid transport system ATP-binding protein
LFNLITGVYPATKGKVFFEDQDITSIPPHGRCWLGIARTFQLVRPLPELSVLDNAAIGRVWAEPIKAGPGQRRSRSKLEVVGLAQRAVRRPRPA